MGLWMRSTIGALISSYAGIIAFRIINSTIIWLVVMSWINIDETLLINLSSIGPLLIYACAIPLMGLGIFRKAEQYV